MGETPTPSPRRLLKDYLTPLFFGRRDLVTFSHGQVQADQGEEAYAQGPHLEEGSRGLGS